VALPVSKRYSPARFRKKRGGKGEGNRGNSRGKNERNAKESRKALTPNSCHQAMKKKGEPSKSQHKNQPEEEKEKIEQTSSEGVVRGTHGSGHGVGRDRKTASSKKKKKQHSCRTRTFQTVKRKTKKRKGKARKSISQNRRGGETCASTEKKNKPLSKVPWRKGKISPSLITHGIRRTSRGPDGTTEGDRKGGQV